MNMFIQKLWLFVCHNSEYLLVKIMTICLSEFLIIDQIFDQSSEYLLVTILISCCSKIWLFVRCRSLVEVSTKLRHQCRSLVETATKLRPSTLRCRSLVKSDYCLVKIMTFCWVKTLIICWSKLWRFVCQNYEYCLVKILTTCWSEFWLVVWSEFWLFVGQHFDNFLTIWILFITPHKKQSCFSRTIVYLKSDY